MSLAGLETMQPASMWDEGESIWRPKPPPVRYVNESGDNFWSRLAPMVTGVITMAVALASIYVSRTWR